MSSCKRPMMVSQTRVNRLGSNAAAGDRRWAAGWLLLAGLGVIIGSFLTWDMCLHVPCEADGPYLSAIWQRSGVEIGPGILTAVCGLLIALAGSFALWRGGRSPFTPETLILGLLSVVIPAVYVIAAHATGPFALSDPTYGFYVVIGAGSSAALAAALLPDPDPSSRARALDHRRALAMLICGFAIWLLVAAGTLPVRLEPLTYVVVLLALGLALWPRRLPLTATTPATAGAALILYGGFALAIVLANGALIALLEWAPVAPLVALAAVQAVRSLPPLDPPLISGAAERWRNKAATAIGSARVVFAGGLGLTAVALALLLSRLIGTEDGRGWVSRFGIVSPGVVVLLLLIAAGIATAAYIAWQSVRCREARVGS